MKMVFFTFYQPKFYRLQKIDTQRGFELTTFCVPVGRSIQYTTKTALSPPKKSYICWNSFFAYQKLIPRPGSILRSSVCESDALTITLRKQRLRRQKLTWYIPSLKKCIFLKSLTNLPGFSKKPVFTPYPPRSRKTGIATWNRKNRHLHLTPHHLGHTGAGTHIREGAMGGTPPKTVKQ